jgi:hypothetical protein
MSALDRSFGEEYSVLTAIARVLNSRVLLLTARLHPHHAVVSVGDTVCAAHRCEHIGTLGGTLALRASVEGLHTVGPISAVSLLTGLCNRTGVIRVSFCSTPV